MFINYIQRREYDENLAEKLQNELKVPLDYARLLTARNITSGAEAEAFLNPTVENMRNPFEINGMLKAKVRIEKAIAEQESVVIYGDYDCDGICAIAILYLYLSKFLNKVNYFIPNRHEEGYGLHKSTIDIIYNDFKPDLIITVDCGITSANEIEYIKQLGIDTIITDHHEPHGELPDCIIVNPKVEKQGFYDYCGAGVALKVVEALSSREVALQYVDIAALATIADIVPLIDENRFIAKSGLEKINKKNSFATNLMMQQLKTEKISAYDIMFKVAPRFNAAGRMGDATNVVNAFISQDEVTVKNILEKIEIDNQNRQKLCENTVNDILLKLENYDLTNNRIILMYDNTWDAGILGIAAARLSELFYRPVLLFSEKDGILKGSARSIHNINIFEILSKFSHYFEAFGGHSAAAGVTMQLENFNAFFADINKYMQDNFKAEIFYPNLTYDLKLTKVSCSFEFMELLDKFEPIGYGNPQPVFLIKNFKNKFYQVGKTNHIKFKWKFFELMGFNLYPFIDSLNSVIDVTFTMSQKSYMGRKFIQGIIHKALVIEPKNINEKLITNTYEKQKCLPLYELSRPLKKYTESEFNKDNSIFGKLYVAFQTDTYYNFVNKLKSEGRDILYNISRSLCVNPYNRVVLMPEEDFSFGYYRQIILLDMPLTQNYIGWLQSKTTAEIYLAYEEC